jgi:hypothetical protein
MSRITTLERDQIRGAAEDAYGPFGANYVVKLIDANPDFDLAEVVEKTMSRLGANEEFLEAVLAIKEARKLRPASATIANVPRREFKPLVKEIKFGTDGTK